MELGEYLMQLLLYTILQNFLLIVSKYSWLCYVELNVIYIYLLVYCSCYGTGGS
jgi:hypothetical protein